MPTTDPSGELLAYIKVGGDGEECGQTGLVVRDLSASRIESWAAPLTTERGSGQIQPPIAWSPDGSSLALSLTNGDLLTLDIHHEGPSLDEAAKLFPRPSEGIQRPVWGPDGLMVLAVASEGSYLRPFDPEVGVYGEPVAPVPMNAVYDVSDTGDVLYAGAGQSYPSILTSTGEVVVLPNLANETSLTFARH